MGIPNHYSRDVAMRCQSLIQHLLPKISAGLPDDARFGGPLHTTFLLAMATPMIVLPVERIFKPGEPGAAQAGDDRELDPGLAGAVADVLGNTRTFGDAPFARTSRWSYVRRYPPFNIAGNWPNALLEALGSPRATDDARRAPASRILLDLRNALAHGGVAYLDERGRNDFGGRAAMFAFAGAVIRDRKLVGLNILRVDENDFGAFLAAWTEWLAQTRVQDALNDQTPLAA